MYDDRESEEAALRKAIAELDKQLDAHRSKIKRARIAYKQARYERQKLARRLMDLPDRTYVQRSGMDDPESTPDIAKLKELIDHWAEQYDGVSGWQRSLAERSGVSSKTISNITNERVRTTTYTTLDRLLTAMDCGWLIHEFTIIATKRGRPAKPPESQYYEE